MMQKSDYLSPLIDKIVIALSYVKHVSCIKIETANGFSFTYFGQKRYWCKIEWRANENFKNKSKYRLVVLHGVIKYEFNGIFDTDLPPNHPVIVETITKVICQIIKK